MDKAPDHPTYHLVPTIALSKAGLLHKEGDLSLWKGHGASVGHGWGQEPAKMFPALLLICYHVSLPRPPLRIQSPVAMHFSQLIGLSTYSVPGPTLAPRSEN